jgi:hypothetical protein
MSTAQTQTASVNEELWKEINFRSKRTVAYYEEATAKDDSIIIKENICSSDEGGEVSRLVNMLINGARNHPTLHGANKEIPVAVKCQIKGIKEPIYFCSSPEGDRVVCREISYTGRKYPV